MVLKGVAAKYNITIDDKPTPAEKFGIDASRVTVNLAGVDLEDVLNALSDQSSNPLIVMPEKWEARVVSFQATDMPYWQALDKLCEQEKLTYTTDMRDGACKLYVLDPENKAAADISAYAGPVVVKIESATLVKRYRQSAQRFQTDGLTCMFTYRIEPRLKPLNLDAEITKVVDEQGRELKMTEEVQNMFRRAARSGYAAAAGVGNTMFNIAEPPAGLRTLREITGKVTVETGEGERMLTIRDPLGGNKESATLAGVTLTVSNVNRNRGGVSLTMAYTRNGQAEAPPTYPRNSPYGAVLIDPNGAKHQGMSFAGFGGGFGGPGRRGEGNQPGQGAQPGPAPAAPRAENNTFTVMFQQLPEIEGNWSLVYTMPANTVETEFPFTMKDVPLP
jgi:hypothetical protein